MEKIEATLIDSSKPLNKLFDKNGKKSSRGVMDEGTATKITVHSIEELFDGFKKFKENQAITVGVTKYDEVNLVVSSKVDKESISRTKKYFSFPETAFLLLDYDPSENGYNITSPEQFVEVLRDIDPDLEKCDIGVRYGSSYGIMKDDSLISDKKSFHGYIMISNASDDKVLKYRDYLIDRAWSKGYGHIELSKTGSIMRRQIFDAAVFSPERLIFEAPPTLEAGITRLVSKHYIAKGGNKNA